MHKFTIAFIVVITIFFTFAIKAYAVSVTLSPLDSPFDVTQPDTYLSQYLTPTPYYAKFSIVAGSEQRYLIIYFENDVTFTLSNTMPIRVPSGTRAKWLDTSRTNINSNFSGYSGSGNSFQNANYTIYYFGINSTWYLVDHTVTVRYNGSDITPPPTYTDDFIVYSENYNINFDVRATLNSRPYNAVIGQCFVSDSYDLTLKFTSNNNTYYYTVPSYMYNQCNTTTNINNNGVALHHFEPIITYWDRMQSVKLYNYEFPDENPPTTSSYTTLNSTTYESANVITLNQLFTALQDKYPDSDLTYNDLYTVITCEFHYKSNGKIAHSDTVDFSEYHTNDNSYSTPPPDEDNIPDQTDPFDLLNQYLSSNKYYLDLITKGETYINLGMSAILEDAPTINDFTKPDYTYQQTTLNSDAMGFFSRMVTWWWDSPFGIIAIVALTFLVIKTIVW